MKKQNRIILLLCLLLCSMGVNAAEGDTVQVSTCKELKAAIKANKCIQLVADIDMKNYGDPVKMFSGTIDGAEFVDDDIIFHTLSNMKERFADFMSKATVTGVNFKDCQPCWHWYEMNDQGMGLLCKRASYCTFTCLEFDNIKVYYEGALDGFFLTDFVSRHHYGGLLVGNAYECSFTNIDASNSYVYVKNDYAGGMAGWAEKSEFTDITIESTCGVHAQGRMELADTDVGGIVGHSVNCSFKNCENRGSVSTPMDDLGGIVGHAEEACTFEHCTNYGNVSHYDLEHFDNLTSYATQLGYLYSLDSRLVNEPLITSNIEAKRDYENGLYDYNSRQKEISSAQSWENNCLKKLKATESRLKEAYKTGWESSIKTAKGRRDEYQALYDDAKLTTKKLMEDPFGKEKPTTPQLNDYDKVAGYVGWIMMVIQVAQIIYEAQDDDNVGGIVGLMEDGGKLTACANYGIVFCSDAYSGGIAGEAKGDGLVIESCYNGGVVSGAEQVGGIVGSISGTLSQHAGIFGCLNTGNVARFNGSWFDNSDDIGRIYGYKRNTNSWGNCVSGNKIEDTTHDRRMVSQQMLASGNVTQYLNLQYKKWDGYSKDNASKHCFWRQTIGSELYPSLDTHSDSLTSDKIKNDLDTIYHVTNAIGLMLACTNQYAHIVLDNDIEVGGIFNFSSNYMPFNGTLDGQGHSLKNCMYQTKSREAVMGSGSRSDDDNALFSCATNATFKNLTLDNFNLIYNGGQGTTEMNALLVARSKNCHYENVHVTGNSCVTGDYDFMSSTVRGHKAAALVAHSQGDTFIDCSVGPGVNILGTTSFIDGNSEVGGLTCLSYHSTFIRCYNAGTISGDGGDYVGGLSCKDEGSTFNSCFNMGHIKGGSFLGGLVGRTNGSKFNNCVNTGTIDGDGSDFYVGGLVGNLDIGTYKYSDLTHNCYNFGTINNSGYNDGANGALYYRNDGSTDNVGNHLFYIKLNGKTYTNLTDQQLADMKSGAFAFTLNKDSVLWYQTLDNHKTFGAWPVPIPEAGSVMENYLCDASNTLKYSNKYNATEGHTHNISSLGICKECGYMAQAPESDATIDISDAQDLADFYTIVSNSTTYNGISARLMNDIDLTGYVFDGIGSKAVPYCGKFNGRGHRIKNMSLTAADNKACGFFNYLGNGAVIDSLTIDASCTISGSGYGVAGIAGCLDTSSGSTCNVTIINCGNEAAITAARNAAGILGGVYTNDKSVITITNCYNTGYINGSNESATLCGYARNNYTFTNCYNAGSLSGGTSGNLFYRNASSGTHKVENCYDLNGKQGDGVKALTSDQITSGELCYLLNGSQNLYTAANGFYQQLDSAGSYPCHDVNKYNVVRTAPVSYCDNASSTAYYNYLRPASTDLTEIKHYFDDNGFCTAVSGETHYEEPDTIHMGNGIVYQLKNAGNLYWLAEQVNDGWSHPNCELMNDIIVNADVNTNINANNTSNLRQWIPIGTEKHPYYSATFNGNGHTISGLYCSDGDKNGVGLFGFAYNGAVVRNVGVTDCYLVGKNGVGAIVGWGGESYTDNSTWTAGNGPSIFQCFSTGYIKGENYAGGLAGFINNGTVAETNAKISTCFSTVNVEECPNYGALFGYMGSGIESNSTLNRCYWNESAFAAGNRNGYGTKLTTQDFANGNVCDLLVHNEEKDSISWSQDLATESIPHFGTDGVKLSRTVNQKWGTAVLPYTVYSDSTITYFEIDTIMVSAGSDIASLRLKQVEKVASNTPCFFRNNSDTTVVVFRSEGRELTLPTANTIDVTKTFSDNDGKSITFTGVCFESVEAGQNQFVLTCDSALWNKNQISASAVKIAPFYAYFSSLGGTNLSGVKQLNIVIKGEDFDFNEDGVFDEQDIVFINDLIAGKTTSDYMFDVNSDGKLTMSDVTVMADVLRNPVTVKVITPPSSEGVIMGK